MNSLSLNRDMISSRFSACSNFGEIIESLENECWQRGDVICQVSLNGNILDESTEQELAKAQISEIQSIEIVSQPIERLLKETVSNIELWVQGAIKNSEICAESIMNGKVESVHAQLADLFDGIYWLLDSLYLVKSSFKNVGVTIEEGPWEQHEISFRKLLTGMIGAFEKKDYIYLGDALDFELPEILNKWLEILKTHNTMIESK